MKKGLIGFGVLCTLAMLVLAYQYSQNGRYMLQNPHRLLDTRTGATYRIDKYKGTVTRETPPVE